MAIFLTIPEDYGSYLNMAEFFANMLGQEFCPAASADKAEVTSFSVRLVDTVISRDFSMAASALSGGHFWFLF